MLRSRIYTPDRKVAAYRRYELSTNLNPTTIERLEAIEYDALTSQNHIRLLTLEPGQESSLMSFSLATYTQEQCPPYEALSYTWGIDGESEVKNWKDSEFKVTPNLIDALHRLRHTQNPRTLWIDAICINQKNVSEKSSQVLLMRDIYTRASSVVVWLGNEATTTARAFQLLQNISTAKANSSGEILAPDDLLKLGLPASDSSDWKALDAIFWRAWFYRVWIIQEIVVAKSATIFCGRYSISWADLVGIASYLQKQNITSSVSLHTESVMKLVRVSSLYRSGTTTTLHQLLVSSRFTLASDNRDHIYALLGLTNDTVGRTILPNYSAELAEVLKSVTTEIIKCEKSLDVLSSNPDSFWSTTPGLPSWAVEWSRLPKADPFLSITSDAAATRKSLARVDFLEDDGLQVAGHTIDSIHIIGRYWQIFQISSDIPAGASVLLTAKQFERVEGSLLNNLAEFAERFAEAYVVKYPTGEEPVDVYVKTIFAGQELVASPLELYSAFTRHYMRWRGYFRRRRAKGIYDNDLGNAIAAKNAIIKAMKGRRLCTTGKGYLGIFPASSRSGDSIVLLSGGKTPYVIRKKTNNRWRFVGECYIHGYMKGEAWDEQKELENFILY
jgi:hypothetical protein